VVVGHREKYQGRGRVSKLGGVLARNTVLNVAGQLVPIGVALLAMPYVVAGLGEARFGVLALAWAALGYFGVMDLGLGRAATKFIAEALGRGEPERVPRLLTTAVAVQAAFGVTGGLALAGVAPWLAASALNVPADLVAETRGAFYVIALALPVVMVTGSVRGALEAAQRFDLINAVTVPASSATFLFPVLGVALGWGLPGIVALLFAGRAITLVALTILALPAVPGLPGRPRIDRGELRRMLGFGGWVMVSNMTVPVLGHLERFLIPALLAVGALTYYAIPYEVLVRVSIIPAAMALTLFPAFSYLERRDDVVLDQLFARPLKYLLLVMTPALAFLGIFAEPLLAAWLGAGIAAQAALPMRILVVAFYLNAFGQIPFVALQGLGRPDLKAKLDLVQIPLFIGLLLVLIPRYGIAGAAAAKLAVTTVDVAALFFLAGRVRRSAAGRRYPTALRQAAGLSAVFIAAAIALSLAGLETGAAMVGFGVLALGFAAAFWRVSVDGIDRTAMLRLLRRARGEVAT
jgi:O-antigen/teichoic acid export membrane protein